MTKAPEIQLAVLSIHHDFDAPIQRVFEAFTDPHKMSQWFFGYPGGSAKVENELVVGGKYRIEMIHPSKQLADSKDSCDSPVHYGEYLEIDPPKRLRFTWINDGFVSYSEVAIEFQSIDTGTRIHLAHKLPADLQSIHQEGWNACFSNLRIALSERKI
ncbi:SRPBCC domain-containing protein [Pelagicoccus sp. SDUM812003]|uniref:SRPBCC family protein n=1 Tax=Pelagicoccus sp. SDUM812003 TaxID=3041267 RepID=UPI00280F8D33|nr:SRPBCC domain-containing protein [Pelagicoccus sp. SDUM812003]MDQ8203210.1 SRPBCC domain-containing protein [Pelagicoccus sp. SDUM812003]